MQFLHLNLSSFNLKRLHFFVVQYNLNQLVEKCSTLWPLVIVVKQCLMYNFQLISSGIHC